jgi:hypothetical protein
VALGQVFSEYFGFPCQSSFHQLLHNHPQLSSGVCTLGQKWPHYLVDLVPPHKIKKRPDIALLKVIWKYTLPDTLLYTAQCTHIHIHIGATQSDADLKFFCFNSLNYRIIVPLGTRSSSPGIKRPRRQDNHSPLTSAEVKNTQIYKSTLLYVFIA